MLCVCVAEKSVEDVKKLCEGAEMAEIRLDAAAFTKSEVNDIFSSIDIPLVATYRPGNVDEKLRIELLIEAVRSGAAYIDIEIENSDDLIQMLIQDAESCNVKTIISYHNYEVTPGEVELRAIIDTALRYKADIVKIATMVNSCDDAARLLSLYDNPLMPLIALGMGEAGKVSRIAAPMLGSPFTFTASDQDKGTAPGQLNYSTMKKIYTLIRE